MRTVHVLLVLALALVVAGGASAGQQDAEKGKKGMHPVHGVVTAVAKDSITLKVKQGKKKGGGTTEKTFKLSADTKYETVKVTKVKGQKPQKETAAAAFGDLQTGKRVLIVPQGEAAAKVSIVERAKGKAKKAA
jgi:hypothetical protein